MEDKPQMYHNKISKEFNNNKSFFASYERRINNKWDSSNIRKKIDEIINANTFIYSKLVNIVIDGVIIKKKIIGIFNNNLITIDNEYIPVDSIQDIYI